MDVIESVDGYVELPQGLNNDGGASFSLQRRLQFVPNRDRREFPWARGQSKVMKNGGIPN